MTLVTNTLCNASSNQQPRAGVRDNPRFPRKSPWSILIYQFEIIGDDKVSEDHLQQSRSIKPSWAGNGRPDVCQPCTNPGFDLGRRGQV